MINKFCVGIDRCADNAALREENDRQRHSIKQLSAQVAGLREGLTVIRDNPELWKRPKIGGPDKYAGMPPLVRKIDSILSSPDPGAEIMERMKKLEAVVEALRNYRKFASVYCDQQENIAWQKVDKALADLREGNTCT